MTHRYPTRYQSTISRSSVSSDDMEEEVIRQEPMDHQQQQVALYSALIPHEMQNAVIAILTDHYDEKIVLTDTEKKEAEQIYTMIRVLTTQHSKTKFMTIHYPIIGRLHANIELFTYMKNNHELIKRFNYLANIFHDYYSHFSLFYSTLWNKCIDPTLHAYKDVYLPYCTLLHTIKDIIHAGEMIFINKNILKYY